MTIKKAQHGVMRTNLIAVSLLLLFGCAEKEKASKEHGQSQIRQTTPTPIFNPDSAYGFIAKQVSFGPRVPNSKAHEACGIYLEEKLMSYGLNVITQTGQVSAYNGVKLNFKNIIASYNPLEKTRIMLCAHWDTRPYADQDKKNPNTPNLGANDGGSGVGVLLEIARLLQFSNLKLGIDILLFDVEDYGKSQVEDSYCLGSQYWSKNKHVKNYHPKYGILLDMVGAENATFTMEGYSMMYAPHIVKSIWKTAAKIGYSHHFIFKRTNPMIDDHYYVNHIGGIPCIDIIQHDASTISGFGQFWHTHDDDMTIISKSTLKAVGQTLLTKIYSE